VLKVLKAIKTAFEKHKTITADIEGKHIGKRGDTTTEDGEIKITLKDKFWKQTKIATDLKVAVELAGRKTTEYKIREAFDGKIKWYYYSSRKPLATLRKSNIKKDSEPTAKKQILDMVRTARSNYSNFEHLENSGPSGDSSKVILEEEAEVDGVDCHVISKTRSSAVKGGVAHGQQGPPSSRVLLNNGNGLVPANPGGPQVVKLSVYKQTYYFGKKDGIFRKLVETQDGKTINTLIWKNIKVDSKGELDNHNEGIKPKEQNLPNNFNRRKKN